MVKKPFSRFIFKEDQNIFYLLHKQLTETSQPQACEIRLVKNDGVEFWTHLETTATLDQDGAPVSCVVLSDITNRKRAARYRELGRVVLQILNEAGELQDSIQRILTVLKTETEFDAVGIRLQEGDDFPYIAQDGFSPNFIRTENSLIERTAAGGMCRDKNGKVRLECMCGLVISGKTDPTNPLFTPGGSFWTNDSDPLLALPSNDDPRLNPRNLCIHQGYVSVALVPIRNKERNVGLLQFNDRCKGCFTLEKVELLEGIATHIGEALMRRRGEEALREGEVRYRSLFMHSPDAIYINQQDRIALVNDACLKLFGARAAGELLGKTPYDLFHPDYHQVIRQRIRQMRHQGESQPLLEGKIVRFDGGIVDVEVIAAHYPFGESNAIHVILRDITERKQAAENLERSNKELEQFAYAASHDLQEPLRSIVGFLQLLQLHYGDQLDEKGRQYIKRVVAASHRMQIMIRDLLSLSRVTTSNGTFLQTNLNSLVKSVLDNLEPTLRKNHAEVVCADLPILSVDSSQMQSLFQNVILNGIKYNISPNPKVEIGCSPSGNVCQFYVRDNGIGISPQFYQRIFIAFQRLHTAKEYDGTGLGLALCRKIVERHGGKIWVESVPGEGSTFHFTLPVTR
jgi:PAS domain S-box-containing protein